ncbi:hypothetical protein RRG08_022600 [Elysia crispata]|uniref:Uncharacterized protein n=1 Tax=Elysia crispata TaxID=231223 RepID=A0AAE0Z237_9GAST|nr:hypothetical protein RRG08_022600 [Elysia crispata]
MVKERRKTIDTWRMLTSGSRQHVVSVWRFPRVQERPVSAWLSQRAVASVDCRAGTESSSPCSPLRHGVTTGQNKITLTTFQTWLKTSFSDPLIQEP